MGTLRNARMTEYQCLGKRVVIPPTADIAPAFRPNGQYGNLVAEVLEKVEVWDGLDVAESVSDFPDMPLLVVPRRGRSVEWARHARHKARNPGLSPFIRGAVEGQTDIITVHLVMRHGGPVLTRAYAGDVQPPLPWMASARDYDKGGVAGCVAYWGEHAYVYRSADVCRSTLTNRPPNWAR
jgi:hypothetical protein